MTETVFVAGSTGVLGHRLVADLSDRGYDVVGLVRDDAGAERVRRRGGTPRRGDVLEPESLREAAEGADAVVHAATAIPTDGKPAAEDWERNDRVRLEGTRNLLSAADAVGADRLLLQSVTWVARQDDGRRFDERTDPNPDRTTRSALAAERHLRERAPDLGLEHCILRCGWFYAHDSAQTRGIGRRLLAGRMPVVGGGLLGRRDATLSYLHVDDAAGAFATAIERETTGRFHVVDDEPATVAAFFRAFADELDAPEPRRVPGWLARPLVGRDTVRLLTNPAPTTAERFRAATGWEPSVPTYREGARRVVERWLETGRLRETGGGYEWVEEGDTQPGSGDGSIGGGRTEASG